MSQWMAMMLRSELKRTLELPIEKPYTVIGNAIYHPYFGCPVIRDRSASRATLQLIADAMNFSIRRKVLEKLADGTL